MDDCNKKNPDSKNEQTQEALAQIVKEFAK